MSKWSTSSSITENIISFDCSQSKEVTKRFEYGSIDWLNTDLVIEALIELPNIIYFKVDQYDILSIANGEVYRLFRSLYRLQNKMIENNDFIEVWHIRTKRLKNNKLRQIQDSLNKILIGHYKRIDHYKHSDKLGAKYREESNFHQAVAPLTYTKTNELKAYSQLRGDGRLIIRMNPIVEWRERLLTIRGNFNDMFGVDGSNQWFMTNLCYNIDSINAGRLEYRNGKRYIVEFDISDRLYMYDVNTYSIRVKNDEEYPSRNQYCTLFNNPLSKSLSISLNSFQEGGTYDGTWNSLIRRYIPRLNLYQLYRVPSNVKAPLIAPFQWQVQLNLDEHLVNVKISVEMTAHRFVNHDLNRVNYLTKDGCEIETQISRFHFNLVPINDLKFHLESIEQRLTPSRLRIKTV